METSPPRALPSGRATALVFFASGAVLVLEIVALRLVGPYVGVTLQVSSSVIGISLAAIAYGTWLGGRLADKYDRGCCSPRPCCSPPSARRSPCRWSAGAGRCCAAARRRRCCCWP